MTPKNAILEYAICCAGAELSKAGTLTIFSAFTRANIGQLKELTLVIGLKLRKGTHLLTVESSAKEIISLEIEAEYDGFRYSQIVNPITRFVPDENNQCVFAIRIDGEVIGEASFFSIDA